MSVTSVFLALPYSPLHAQLRPEHEGNSIRKRFEYFKDQRTPIGVALPDDVRSRAIDHVRSMEESKLSESVLEAQPEWKLIGPLSTGGRVKSIIVHPTNPNTVYIGAAAGGVWRSDDAGGSWTPLMDDANAIAFGSLCFDPSNPDVIYAGTGEQVVGANVYLGSGLLRSTDAGVTWKVVGLTNVGSFSRIYAHPKNPDYLMAACMNTNAGVYKSLNKGATWTKMYSGNVYDMTINPSNENEWFIAVPTEGILYTQDGGQSWSRRMNGIDGSVGRTSVQQSPINSNRLYALLELDGLAAIFYSTNRGTSWINGYRDPQGCFFSGSCSPSSSQGFYDNYVAVSPHDSLVAFAAGIDIWRTTNGGVSWENTTWGYNDGNGSNVPHVDQHSLAFHTSDRQTIYAGNDGGMLRSTNLGATWSLINNNLAISQFYSFDVDPTDKDRAFGGTQDNGTLASLRGMEWDTIQGGDGMVTIVNYNNPNMIFGNFPNGTIWRLNLASRYGKVAMEGIDNSEAALWVAPLSIAPNDSYQLLHGRTRVWRTFDEGEFWYDTSPYFTSSISALEMSAADPEVIWAAGSSGEIKVSEDDGIKWRSLPRTELSNRFISDIECSRTNRNTTWISFGSYGMPNVWKTTDMGNSWTPLWNGMPDVPVNAIKTHPDDESILFIATDVGVFATFNGGMSWVPYGKGLPRSPVTDLKIHKEFGLIKVVTHGRSAWETTLLSVSPDDPEITSPTGGDTYTGTLRATLSWSGFSQPVTVEYSVDDGLSWIIIASGVVGNAMSWAVPNWPTPVGRIRVTSETDNSQQEVSRNFTIVTLAKGGIVQQTAVPWVPYGIAWDGRNGLWTTSFYEPAIYKLNAKTLRAEKKVALPSGVGDSLFTDLTFDKSTGLIYMHRLYNSNGIGGDVIVVDTNGVLVKVFASGAKRYPTGLELVGDQLIAVERDGSRRVYVMDKNGTLIADYENPYQFNYGPRCLAYNDNGSLYQTSTFFPSSGGSLTEAYVLSIPTSSLSTETDRMPLTTPNGLINARAIEYDRSDGNLWIGDFGGSIYKITGFNFVPPAITSVEDDPVFRGELSISPNPASSSVLVTLGATTTERRVEISIIDLFGTVVQTPVVQSQGAGNELVIRIPVKSLATGTYTVIATLGGTVISTSRLAIAH